MHDVIPMTSQVSAWDGNPGRIAQESTFFSQPWWWEDLLLEHHIQRNSSNSWTFRRRGPSLDLQEVLWTFGLEDLPDGRPPLEASVRRPGGLDLRSRQAGLPDPWFREPTSGPSVWRTYLTVDVYRQAGPPDLWVRVPDGRPRPTGLPSPRLCRGLTKHREGISKSS